MKLNKMPLLIKASEIIHQVSSLIVFLSGFLTLRMQHS